MQVKSLILYLLLLRLKIQLNFSLDISYKQDRFFKTLLKKDFEFILYKANGTITFKLHFILLLGKIDFVLEK